MRNEMLRGRQSSRVRRVVPVAVPPEAVVVVVVVEAVAAAVGVHVKVDDESDYKPRASI